MVGEIYMTFIFLGGSGWVYSKGVFIFYILGYGVLVYFLLYFLLLFIWKYVKEYNFVL